MDSFPRLPHRNSQDPTASVSLSIPSEPPDIGNWFSSYQYKSPDHDSNVNFKDSAFKGCESEEDEEREVNCPKIRSGDDKHNIDQSLTKPKGLDTFSSHSVLLSEPPDIRNWFSSYVYESPMSGMSSHFEDSVSSKEKGCEEVNLIQGKEELKVSRVNVDTEVSITHNSFSDTSTRANQLSSMDDGSVEMKEKVSTFASTSHLEKVLQPCSHQDRPCQHNVNPTKCGESMSLSHESGGCKREHTLTLNMYTNCQRPPDSAVHKTDRKEATSKAKIQHENRGSSETIPAEVFSEWKTTRLREKENIDMTSMNGFVTTRKKRDGGTKDENCGKKTQESSRGFEKEGRYCIAWKKEGDMKRKALAEITNIEICNEMEITGKWKCPRKGKPYVGPPLKQLRLEQWVHRN